MDDRALLVFGARNLGGAIVEHLAGEGWRAAAVARSEETLARVRERGAVAIAADATKPDEVAAAIARARSELGRLDLLVNAVSADRRSAGGPFGGGPLADATLQGFHDWTVAVAEQAFVFLSESVRALREGGSGGTIIQVTGGSSRRAIPGRGLWSAAAHAVKAMTFAAAQELRAEGVHVALLVVDATIESPKTAEFAKDTPRDALADMSQIARAVQFLAEQEPRAMTHELVVTPAGDRWVP
ncbi:MAG TPA: SDR family oxidoreductase [Solirubrobacteraceae bacterium]|nr:SDR family oxidoreductase [Solirubrobacteraceae bacterium]